MAQSRNLVRVPPTSMARTYSSAMGESSSSAFGRRAICNVTASQSVGRPAALAAAASERRSAAKANRKDSRRRKTQRARRLDRRRHTKPTAGTDASAETSSAHRAARMMAVIARAPMQSLFRSPPTV
eukprot:scaffold25203_cov118-Isochrysis_galbana.AAC.6